GAVADVARSAAAPILHLVRVADRLGHQLELGQKISLRLLRDRTEVIEQAREGHLLLVELPRRDFLFHRAAEELRLGHTVDLEQTLELRQLQGADPLAGFERADGLLSDAGKPRDILLAETAHATNLTKFQNEIH